MALELKHFIDADEKLVERFDGAPVYYMEGEKIILCSDCANKPMHRSEIRDGEMHVQGPDLFCMDCEIPIKSYYKVREQEDEGAYEAGEIYFQSIRNNADLTLVKGEYEKELLSAQRHLADPALTERKRKIWAETAEYYSGMLNALRKDQNK